jgi:hypothetical protein
MKAMIDRKVINPGDTILDFRDDKWIFEGLHGSGRSVKVIAKCPRTGQTREFYTQVFQIEVKE